MSETFGEYIRAIRIARRETLRNFCKRTGLDSNKASMLERGLLPAPEVEGGLEDLANAYGIKRRGAQYETFCRLAAESRKRILSVRKIVGFLPLFYGEKSSKQNLLDFIELAEKGSLPDLAEKGRSLEIEKTYTEATGNKPRKVQKELLSAINDVILDDRAKPLAFCTYRRSGKTEALLVAAKIIAEGYPKYRIHYFCPAGVMSEDAYERFLDLLASGTYCTKDEVGLKSVVFANGSVVAFPKSSRHKVINLRGKYPDLTIIDESHFMADADFAYAISNWEETHCKREYFPVISKVVAVSSLGGKRRSIFSDTIRSENSYYGREWTRKVYPISQSIGKDITQEEVDSWKKEYSKEDWMEEFECISSPKSAVRVSLDPRADLEFALFNALHSMDVVSRILKRRDGNDANLGDVLSEDEAHLAKCAKDFGLSLDIPKMGT